MIDQRWLESIDLISSAPTSESVGLHSQLRLSPTVDVCNTLRKKNDTEVFSSVATQLMTTDKVELVGKRLPIRRIGHQRG